MEDAELLARLVDVLGLERDDLEHTAACEQCDLWEDSEHGRYRCADNPAEQRERAALARLEARRAWASAPIGSPPPDFMGRGGTNQVVKLGVAVNVSKELMAAGPVSARPINETTTLVLDETGALDAEQTFGTEIIR